MRAGDARLRKRVLAKKRKEVDQAVEALLTDPLVEGRHQRVLVGQDVGHTAIRDGEVLRLGSRSAALSWG